MGAAVGIIIGTEVVGKRVLGAVMVGEDVDGMAEGFNVVTGTEVGVVVGDLVGCFVAELVSLCKCALVGA